MKTTELLIQVIKEIELSQKLSSSVKVIPNNDTGVTVTYSDSEINYKSHVDFDGYEDDPNEDLIQHIQRQFQRIRDRLETII